VFTEHEQVFKYPEQVFRLSERVFRYQIQGTRYRVQANKRSDVPSTEHEHRTVRTVFSISPDFE
jgi:hypothetical protein